jgi:SAM-dependent methyltransferase
MASPSVELPYIDAEIERLDEGGEPPGYLRHFHWGLFDGAGPADHGAGAGDDSPERYVAAAEAMTLRVVGAGEVTDGARVLDVGCGFGGTLDLIRAHNPTCRLAGVNIDERQLRWARRIVTGARIGFTAADGCRLPVADGSVDHVLAVECVFHFPSRKAFFREAARVLRPGGTLAMSDFLLAPGSVASVTANLVANSLGHWYGRSATPLTSMGYGRISRSVGLDVLVDEDVTARTLPTYPALRRIYRESGDADGVGTIDAVEQLALGGGWEYHVLSFRKREG